MKNLCLTEYWAEFTQKIVDFMGVDEKVLVFASNVTSIKEETFSKIRIAVNKRLACGNSLLRIRFLQIFPDVYLIYELETFSTIFNRIATSFLENRACTTSIKQICSIYISKNSSFGEEQCLQCFKLFNFIIDSLQLIIDENTARYVRTLKYGFS